MRALGWVVVCSALLCAGCTLPVRDEAVRIVPREEWGARATRADISTYEEYGLARPEYTRIVLHVTSMGHGEGGAEMRRIQDFHMDTRGWSDIGYNYLIDSAGTIFEGRSLDFVPAHAGRTVEGDIQHDITLDPDYQAIGIVFSADTDEELTRAQVASGIRLVGALKMHHPIESIITHTEVKQGLISRGLTPRTELDPRVCPGTGSIEQMIEIRLAVDVAFDEAAYRRLFEAYRAPPGD